MTLVVVSATANLLDILGILDILDLYTYSVNNARGMPPPVRSTV